MTEKILKKIKTPRKEKAAAKKTEISLDSKIYDQKGKAVDTIKLPESIFALPWNADLVHQVVVSLMSNKRANIAHTKNRGDVSGGGKKPWQQKGLGRARHGSTRSPIWVGGGVAHGPRNDKDYSRKVNKKMNAKALFTILSRKYKDGEVIFVDKISFAAPKTKDALATLSNFAKIPGCENILSKKNNSAYIAIAKKDKAVEKSFRNFGNIFVDESRNINTLDVLNHKYLIIENAADSVKFLANKIK
ncbi:MAG: 50S ribosomal protein L4 [bacterium]